MIPILRMVLAAALATTCGVAWAKDYSRYHVLDTTALDIAGRPGQHRSSAVADGSRLLQVGPDVCLHALTDAHVWSRVDCTSNMPNLDLRAPQEDLLWSPRGDRLVMPTFGAALLTFR